MSHRDAASDAGQSVPWVERPTLAIDRSLPWTQALSQVSAEPLAQGRTLLDAILHEIPTRALRLADVARLRTYNRFHGEMAALAQAAGVDWRQIMLANLSYDLRLATLGCSTAAVATADGPVLARNMDWWPEDLLARASFRLDYQQAGKSEMLVAGWPGSVGVVTGLSTRGFALALNAVTMPGEPYSQLGYPVLLHLRRVLEDARDFDAALKMLTDTRLITGGLITLVGTRNHERVCVERSPTRYAVRRPEGDEPLVATNDYHLLEPAGKPPAADFGEDRYNLYGSACMRFHALSQALADLDGADAVKDERLLYHLVDSAVRQEITAQHVIARPASGTLRLFVPRELAPGSVAKPA